ncbi:hypothetical protein ACLOJK_007434 [Asimina triloba]
MHLVITEIQALRGAHDANDQPSRFGNSRGKRSQTTKPGSNWEIGFAIFCSGHQTSGMIRTNAQPLEGDDRKLLRNSFISGISRYYKEETTKIIQSQAVTGIGLQEPSDLKDSTIQLLLATI